MEIETGQDPRVAALAKAVSEARPRPPARPHPVRRPDRSWRARAGLIAGAFALCAGGMAAGAALMAPYAIADRVSVLTARRSGGAMIGPVADMPDIRQGVVAIAPTGADAVPARPALGAPLGDKPAGVVRTVPLGPSPAPTAIPVPQTASASPTSSAGQAGPDVRAAAVPAAAARRDEPRSATTATPVPAGPASATAALAGSTASAVSPGAPPLTRPTLSPGEPAASQATWAGPGERGAPDLERLAPVPPAATVADAVPMPISPSPQEVRTVPLPPTDRPTLTERSRPAAPASKVVTAPARPAAPRPVAEREKLAVSTTAPVTPPVDKDDRLEVLGVRIPNGRDIQEGVTSFGSAVINLPRQLIPGS